MANMFHYIAMKQDNSIPRRVELSADSEVERLRRQVAELAGSLALASKTQEQFKLLSALMDSIPDTIYFKDADSRFTLVNRAQARRFKLTNPSEVIGKTDFDFFTAEHAAEAFKDEQRILRTGEPIKNIEERETWAGGVETWVSTTKMPLRDEKGRVVGTFGMSRDITARKLVERQLEQSEARFRAVIQLAPDIIYRVDQSGCIVFISQAVSTLGHTAEELVGKPFEVLVWPEDVPKLRAHIVERRVSDRATRDLELRLVRKVPGGRRRKHPWMDVSISARGLWDVPDGDIKQQRKTFLGSEGIIHDVTERKAAEEELTRHREHLEELVAERTAELRTLNTHLEEQVAERKRAESDLRRERDKARMYLDIAGSIVVVLDLGGKIGMINRRGCEFLGGAEADFVGRDWVESLVAEGDRERLRKVLAGIGAGGVDERFEYDVLARDGQRRTVAWHNSAIRDEQSRVTGMLSAGEDVTERRRTEEALLQGERIEAIGAMAGGVAVRFNNLINTVTTSASAIAANSSPHTRLHDEAIRILEAARQSADLTRRLSMVAHATSDCGDDGLTVTPLSEVFKNVREFIEESLAGKGVRLIMDGAEFLPHVQGAPGPLLDVMLSIIMNAAEAMPSGGSVVVDCKERRVDKPDVRLCPRAVPGNYVVVRIKDDGCGIPPEVLERIFEPFFTTKKSGTSFGLGLPFALNVLRRMGGWIAMRSRVGHGTTAMLYLPKALHVPKRPKTVAGKQGMARNTVLVVDDRSADLAAMRAALEGAGYKVAASSSAVAALHTATSARGKLAAAVVRASFNDGGSKQLFEALLGDPQIATVVTSGFCRDFVRGSVPAGAWSFLQKPFEDAQLVDVVNDAVRQVRVRAEASSPK